MISTFKETIASIRDKNYAKLIIAKSPKQVVWYWSKYLILVSVIFLVISVFSLTHYLPQLPKFINDYFPDGVLSSRDNLLSTTINQPYKKGNSEFVFIMNLEGSASDLDAYTAGVLVLKDQLVFKTNPDQVQIQKLDKVPNFSISKNDLSSYVSKNNLKLWLIGCGILVALSLVGALVNWTFRLVVNASAALLFWISAKYLMKKQINFIDTFKIILYANVLPLLLSFFLSSPPNPIFDFLNLGLFIFLSLRWIRNLPDTVVAVPVQTEVSHPKRKSVKH